MIEITRYHTRVIKGNQVFAPVHLFVQRHDHRKLNVQKSYVTATLKPGQHVLLASSNESLSKYIRMEADCELEVQPLTVAKHLSEILGMPLIILENNYCDLNSKEMRWDLHFYQHNNTTRHVMARQILVS